MKKEKTLASPIFKKKLKTSSEDESMTQENATLSQVSNTNFNADQLESVELAAIASMSTSISTYNDNDSDEVSWPNIWSAEMWLEKKRQFPWLLSESRKLGCSFCNKIQHLGVSKTRGVNISKEWSSTSVSYYGKDKKSQLTSLRKKIFEHAKTTAHINSEKILNSEQHQPIENVIDNLNKAFIKSTSLVFRTA